MFLRYSLYYTAFRCVWLPAVITATVSRSALVPIATIVVAIGTRCKMYISYYRAHATQHAPPQSRDPKRYYNMIIRHYDIIRYYYCFTTTSSSGTHNKMIVLLYRLIYTYTPILYYSMISFNVTSIFRRLFEGPTVATGYKKKRKKERRHELPKIRCRQNIQVQS